MTGKLNTSIRAALIVLSIIAVACGKSTPTTPEVVAYGVSASEGLDATVGSIDVPTVAKAYCGFSSANPYSCCQNSVNNYGNCTGKAWETARARWQGHGLPGWGNAKSWAKAATDGGYVVDPPSSPTDGAIGVNTDGAAGHVAFVVGISSTNVTTLEQQCGAGYAGGDLTRTRTQTYYNGGFIRAPIPTVTMMAWNGSSQASSGGTLNVKKPLIGGVTVQFGFSLLRANYNRGTSSYSWLVDGKQVSTAGTTSYSFSKTGTYSVSVVVRNSLGLSTTTAMTIKVS